MAKYVLDRNIAANIRMFANHPIARGERIHDEAPLISLEVAVHHVFNASSFYDPKHSHNGVAAISRAYGFITDANIKEDIRNLKHGLDDTADEDEVVRCVVERNAFEYDITTKGQKWTYLVVYKDISRINHSCRPNAVVDWNPKLGRGTLHALTAINQGDEIMIDYLNSPEATLKAARTRRDLLKAHYHFTCACVACSLGAHSQDNTDRNAAFKAWQTMEKTTKKVWRESDETLRLRRITAANDYLRLLNRLGLHDQKVALAHVELSQLHEQGFHMGRSDLTHCNECQTNSSPQHHLESAIQSLGRAIRVYTRCWGTDNSYHNELSQENLRLQGLGREYDD